MMTADIIDIELTERNLPSIITHYLQREKISYSLVNRADYYGPVANCTIMFDSDGPLHIISAGNRVLDPLLIAKSLERKLKVVKSASIRARCSKFGLQECPGFPQFLQIDSAVDTNLLWQNEIVIPTGVKGLLLKIPGEDFARLCKPEFSENLSREITHASFTNNDLIKDKNQLTHAVESISKKRVTDRLEEVLELPALPQTARKILALQSDPEADIHSLAKVVDGDPALAAQVVSWASAPYYAAPGKITSVHDAIMRVLGFDLVMNLSIGIALGKSLAMPKTHPEGFTLFWEQSIFVANTVTALANLMPVEKRPSEGTAYLSGLLHNFGCLIMAEIFPPHYTAYCRYQEVNRNINHAHIEQHLITVNREQVAAWLLDVWCLPEDVIKGVRFQNYSEYDAEGGVYANLIYLALHLLREHNIGDAPLENIPQNLLARLGIDYSAAKESVVKVVAASDDVSNIAQMLGEAA